MQFTELFRPEMRGSLTFLQNHERIHSRVLAGGRPAKSAERQVLLVEEKNIQVISGFAAAHEREQLVGGGIIRG